MKKRFLSAVTMLLVMLTGAWADGVHFTYEKQAYDHLIYVALVNDAGSMIDAGLLSDADYYLGAYIDGECRGEAHLEFLNPDTGEPLVNPLFTMRVYGNNTTDINKTITFRIWKTSMVAEGQAEYIIPSSAASVAYNADNTSAEPSNPYKVKFVPATSIELKEMSVPIGGTIDLMEQIETVPKGSLLPYPITWNQGDDSYEISQEGILTALKATVGSPVMLQAGTGIFAMGGNGTVIILNTATSFAWTDRNVVVDEQDPTKGTITVSVNDAEALYGVLYGGGFSMKGIDPDSPVTTTFEWASSNLAVVGPSPTSAQLSPLTVGTAVVTGTANDGTNIAPQLTVKVVQPVEYFTFGQEAKADSILVLQVGDDVKERLTAMVNAYPANATDKTYTILANEEYFDEKDGKIIAKQSNANGSWDVAVTDDLQNIALRPNDGFRNNNPQLVKVIIIPTQPKEIVAKETTIFMVTPDVLPQDISAQLYGNLALTPDTMKVSDYTFDMTSDNESVVAELGEDGKGQPMFSLLGSGQVTMTVTLSVLDNLNIKVNEPDPTSEYPTVTIFRKELSTKFNVQINDGLSEFTFDPIRTTVGESIEITLTPQPANVEYEPGNITVTITPSTNMPQGWTFASVTAKEGDKTGLKWIITPKSVGNGTITVNYLKNQVPTAMGNSTINVDQQFTLKDGWQWISLFQGHIADKDTMLIMFGQKLGEIRSENAVVYNDAKYGYFGALSSLEPLKTYKLRMKDLGNPTAYTLDEAEPISSYFLNNDNVEMTGGPKAPLSIVTQKGWNWIGNPYQYNQYLTDIFGNTVFTEGDIIKGKTSFATFTNGQWAGELQSLTPGEGYLFYVANAGQIDFVREFDLKQQTAAAGAPALNRAQQASPWTIDDSPFADNMSMIAHVGGLADASRLTLYAFVGNECRGRGVAVGDRQFITIHGERGERITFCVYDEVSDQYYQINGSRAFAVVSGTMEAPVALYAGEATSIEAVENMAALDGNIYDLQGRRVVTPRKGIYVQGGKKLIK